MSGLISVAALQLNCSANTEENLRCAESSIRQAANDGANCVVLPELHANSYFCQQQDQRNFELAQPIPGLLTDWYSAIAKELGIVLVGSVFELRLPGLYHNTAIVIDTDGRIAGSYRKMHIPDDPGYNEKYYFAPGDQGFHIIETSIAKLGVMICWDQWFPEAARLMALAGAELLIYPTAIGWELTDSDDEKMRQLDAWVTIQRSHAIANGLPVIACNRTGFEAHPTKSTKGIDFWGHSFICDGFGQLRTELTVEPGIIASSVDLLETAQLRQTWPFLRDRRVDTYGALTKRSI